ncbi:MAG: helix-turn-helix transcriptional regulator [Oscillospiraceae bacterium]|nr:helix-turn-helix transcriptional regulator [Oscillospiraceae bacterium]
MAKYDRIRNLREDNDRTQQELSDYLGTSTQHYGKYESGNAEIPFERAILLAKYYGVSLDYIAGLTNDKRGLSYGELTPEQKELIEFSDSLTDDEKRKFTELLKIIMKNIK